jgi:crossover junction endodeoxyribonuclease RusA
MKKLNLTLPWPPSLNRIYRAVSGRVVLSEEGRKYALQVSNALPTGHVEPLEGRLHVSIVFCPPEKLAGKKWDLCNREKIFCDALTKCRVWLDDEQVDSIEMRRGQHVSNFPSGVVFLSIHEQAKDLTIA